ncbi:RidA family protein [Phyllobacterium sp. TAF24]|uniref:RidA family protein n=1 Tax=unclassified Phyllobacterium TaxID=2638441 RepID=UPI0008858BFB|nr:RidA family protein [Phyllobacterium sp. OV277]SDP77919.1 Enamine deaminase RidA, house cleaning of reactive enamine intermediates, YjgF/YER057c/UK114 family [Phyllobacterium sp. OV277]
MSVTIAEKLASIGHELPVASTPVANYVSVVRAGNLLSISGQISRIDDENAVHGVVGAAVSPEEGRRAAEIAAINVLSQIAAATDGTIAAARRIVRLGVFMAATPDFTQHPQVANGASDLMVAVFGDAGRHSRAAVGVSSLPRGVTVEIDALVELEG